MRGFAHFAGSAGAGHCRPAKRNQYRRRGNVARNIASLGARCIFVGLIGEDDAGKMLKAALARNT